MNDKTVKLIEQLAQKLGTTAEYLWGILIKQAFISAVTDVAILIITLISGWVLWRLHKYFSRYTNDRCSIYDDKEELVIAMIFVSIAWLIAFTVCLFSISNIINGFFNPEYWALQQILNANIN